MGMDLHRRNAVRHDVGKWRALQGAQRNNSSEGEEGPEYHEKLGPLDSLQKEHIPEG